MISIILKFQVSSFPLLKSTIIDFTLFNLLQSFAILFQKKKEKKEQNRNTNQWTKRRRKIIIRCIRNARNLYRCIISVSIFHRFLTQSFASGTISFVDNKKCCTQMKAHPAKLPPLGAQITLNFVLTKHVCALRCVRACVHVPVDNWKIISSGLFSRGTIGGAWIRRDAFTGLKIMFRAWLVRPWGIMGRYGHPPLASRRRPADFIRGKNDTPVFLSYLQHGWSMREIVSV